MNKRKLERFAAGTNARRWSLGLLVALTIVAGAALSGAVGAKTNSGAGTSAVDAFIPGVSESVATRIVGEAQEQEGMMPVGIFEIKDFSFGVENPTTIGSATGGAGAGKIKFNEFTIKKTSDKASPAFFKNCAAGAHYDSLTIDIRQVDKKGNETPYMTFKLETVFTTKIDWSGPGDEGPEESITFVYGKLTVVYHEFDPETGRYNDVSAGWDQVLNKST